MIDIVSFQSESTPLTVLSSSSRAVNKKPMKDTMRWQQQQQQQHSHHRQQQSRTHEEDDGGWSTGVPERGSGWGSLPSGRTGTEAREQDSWSKVTTASSVPEEGTAGAGRRTSGGRASDWLTVDSAGGKGSTGGTSDTETWRSASPGDGQCIGSSRQSQNEGWVSDGSQSTGESAMLLPLGMTTTTSTAAAPMATVTPSTTSSTSSDPSNGCSWGMGSNWKQPDPIEDDLELELSKELELYGRRSGGNGRAALDVGSDWDELDTDSTSSNERDSHTYNGDATGMHTTPGGSRKSSQETNPGLGGSQGSYSAKTMSGGKGAMDPTLMFSPGDHGSPSPLEGYKSPDFRTSEAGGAGSGWPGRGNLGSTSSVNSVGSSSSWKSEGKGGRERGQSKPGTPRKAGR